MRYRAAQIQVRRSSAEQRAPRENNFVALRPATGASFWLNGAHARSLTSQHFSNGASKWDDLGARAERLVHPEAHTVGLSRAECLPSSAIARDFSARSKAKAKLSECGPVCQFACPCVRLRDCLAALAERASIGNFDFID